MTYFSRYHSPLGVLTIASDGTCITGLWMEGQKHFKDVSNAVEDANVPAICQATQWLDAYFSGCAPKIDIPALMPSGTAFQQQVWAVLRRIPYGETITYGQISQQVTAAMGKSQMSSQAVGNAVGRNPISILIPCHRVIGAKGELTGYAGGIERKAFLLRLERKEAEE